MAYSCTSLMIFIEISDFQAATQIKPCNYVLRGQNIELLMNMKVKYDFDKVVCRKGTESFKWDGLGKVYGREDLIPLWVADMDFETPDFIIDALRKRLEHPVLGYTMVPDSYIKSIIAWQKRRNNWEVSREQLTFIPGIVKGIAMAIQAFTKPGDKIIVQPPIYHPFFLLPEKADREVVWNPLKPVYSSGNSQEQFNNTKNCSVSPLNDDCQDISRVENENIKGCGDKSSNDTLTGYEMDFEQLEEVIDGAKMLILSNPHNPAGIVWSADTLAKLASICHKHGVIVISDEIHSDMTLFGHRHIPFATVSPEAAECSITFTSPSKTFNIAGVVSSYAVVINPELRKKFYGYLETGHLNSPHMFATIAVEAAYTYGDEWLEQMLKYVEENALFVEKFLAERVPQIKVLRPQASFLVWLDCRGLFNDKGLFGHDNGLHENGSKVIVGKNVRKGEKIFLRNQAELVDFFVNKVGIALNDGTGYGPGGEGFMRLNIGARRTLIAEALEKLATAIAALT